MICGRRLLRTVVLSLLLLGVQYGGELHALEHVGEALRHAKHQSFDVPNDEICAICALFAGGANALADHGDTPTPAFVGEDDPPYAPPSIAPAAPHFYDSRAPPVLL